MNLGDKNITGNPENLMGLRKSIITDVLEVRTSEHYYEITEVVILKGSKFNNQNHRHSKN